MPARAKQAPKARYLFLLRHAKAVPYGRDDGDFGRELSERGESDALKMAALFESQGFKPERCLCSPALRTKQTFKALAELVPGLKASYPKDLYLISHQELLARIQKMKDDPVSVLVVGHNPGIERLSLLLAKPMAGGDDEGLARMKDKFPTGALSVLRFLGDDWKDLAEGTCRLEAFVRPKDLEA
ncbi:MAG: histidine phosphatase family protein [Alphaproteobacteria bacterium]|nr:histidine phosphatase family protein [Alphaproteobacteria bacterium]